MASPLFPSDTIKDVADSLGIQTLSADAAKQLAMEVEYRLQEVVQEALKVMRHSKRTVLTPADISSALRTLNIEPLYGYNSSRPIKFREATTQDGLQLYYLDDDEVEFEKIINQPLPKIPREVEFAAHWLAIEGVQPAIVQNPTLADLKAADQSTAPTGTGTSSSLAAASGAEGVETKREIKHVLSKELQLYYEKVTKALVNEDTEAIRETAIASLRNDRGLHQLVPYLVAFVAEKITHNLKNILILNVMLHTIWALLDNPNINIEPYLHQLMPAIITCLIAKRLGDSQRSTPRETYALRDLAVSLLKRVLDRYSSSYYTMKPRTARALLQAFLDNNKPFTTHYGAVAGLRVMGREVVRSLVIPNLRIYGEVVLAPALGDEGDISVREDAERVLDTIMVALNELVVDVPSEMQVDVGPEQMRELNELLGEFLTSQLLEKNDEALIAEILRGIDEIK